MTSFRHAWVAFVVAVVAGVVTIGCTPGDLETPDPGAGEQPTVAHAGARNAAGYRRATPPPRLPDPPELVDTDDLVVDDFAGWDEHMLDEPAGIDDEVDGPWIDPDRPDRAGDYVPTAEDHRFFGQVMSFIDQFVAAIEGNAGACDAMATSVEQLIAQHRPLLEAGKQLDRDGPRSRWFAAEAEARMMPMVMRLVTPLQDCMEHPRLMSVIASAGE
jgi:hypothetical protein